MGFAIRGTQIVIVRQLILVSVDNSRNGRSILPIVLAKSENSSASCLEHSTD